MERGADGDRPRIMVVEDEALVAADLAATLAGAGFAVDGPFARVRDALAHLAAARPAAALLDANLGGEMVEPVADLLADLGIPFAFVTGYSDPPWDRHARVAVVHKPAPPGRVLAAVRALLG